MSRLQHWMRHLFVSFVVVACVPLLACTEGQISEQHGVSFSTTARCDTTQQILEYTNEHDEPLEILQIGFSAGSNAFGNFSLLGMRINGTTEIDPLQNGSIASVSVPAGASYEIGVSYAPAENTWIRSHTATLEVVFTSPKEGIQQINLEGLSAGEGNCSPSGPGPGGGIPPEVETGLDGAVTFRVEEIVAISTQLDDAISSAQGVRPFVPVELDMTLDSSTTTNNATFHQITSADNFVVAPPDPALSPTLPEFVQSDSFYTSSADVVGHFDSSTGRLEVPDLALRIQNSESLVNMVITLTTDSVTTGPISIDKIRNAGFVLDSSRTNVLGSSVQTDGSVTLVGITIVDVALGSLLDAANGQPLIARIVGKILCPNGTTECGTAPAE